MPFDLTIPRSLGEPLNLTANLGEPLFILGANGTGKSSLMQKLYNPHQANARRISAHRQNWFPSNSMSLSPKQKRDFESNIRSNDTSLESRWKDDYATQRASIAIYDIIDAENVRARSIAGAVDGDNIDLAKTLSKQDAPIKVINELLGNLHWLNAFGIVDNDRRTEADINRLKEKGVYALSVFSVESIYYHPRVQDHVAQRHAVVTGDNVSLRLTNANTAAIEAIRPHVQRLSERTAEKALREEFFRHLPRREDIASGNPINVSVDVGSFVTQERERLQNALDNDNLVEVISQYPVRETPALDKIAKELGFQNREQYERAVQKLLMDDNEALAFVKSLFGTLESDIEAV